ncbi:NfeD family protein [Massilia sp. KIM]|uniref:NfeD family protein n=1 Tax=Massilia sp. KIM TaxID=1955422 RepID=UPI00098F83A4|nr:NfeD family protein [Massilia sp. KIM]OON62667.1 NfeD family protein [Massilia sp. KIM]
MSDWTAWLIGAGILVIAELFTGTFYLLMIAIGLAAGSLAALAGLDGPLQTLAAAAVGVAATLVLRRTRFGRMARGGAANDPLMHLDIGQRIQVAAWQDRRARVMYRGALWDVELRAGASDRPGDFQIVEVQGNRLIVADA